MERRRLGRTGHESSVAILGGAAFWMSSRTTARGASRSRWSAASTTSTSRRSTATRRRPSVPPIPAVRDQLFVAAKTLRSNPDGVVDQFDESRRLLGCDVLDLYQAHGVTTLDELDNRAPGIERILQLRDEGKCRFAGITGHDLTVPRTFLEALRRYDLDTVMFPVYPRLWADPVYREAAEELLARVRRARPRRDGHQGRRSPAMARSAAAGRRDRGRPRDRGAMGDVVVRAAAGRRRDRTRRVVRAVDAGRARVLHAGRSRPAPPVLDAAERFSPMAASDRAEAADAMADEDVIFPIPR